MRVKDHLAPLPSTKVDDTRPALPINYPTSKHRIERDRFIDDVRELKVAVIGAGMSGINAGIILPAKVPKINLTIFEKNDDVVCPQNCECFGEFLLIGNLEPEWYMA